MYRGLWRPISSMFTCVIFIYIQLLHVYCEESLVLEYNWNRDEMSTTCPEESTPTKDKPCSPMLLLAHNSNMAPDLCGDCPPVDRNKDGRNSCMQKSKRRKKRTLTGVSQQRRAANDRERTRNLKLNQAFVKLKNTLPLPHIHISKIDILRYAIKWIEHLGTLLKNHDKQKDLLKIRQMETSRNIDHTNTTNDLTHVNDNCSYNQSPNLKNTLWEECIGLSGKHVSL